MSSLILCDNIEVFMNEEEKDFEGRERERELKMNSHILFADLIIGSGNFTKQIDYIIGS